MFRKTSVTTCMSSVTPTDTLIHRLSFHKEGDVYDVLSVGQAQH